MTDTIKLPSGVEVTQGRTVIVPALGTVMPVGGLTPAEAQALRDDVALAMNQDLDDLANVSEAGKAEGMALAVQGDGTWLPQNLTGLIERVTQNWDPVTHTDNVKQIVFGAGLSALPHPVIADAVLITPRIGSSGVSDSMARSDHAHPPTITGRFLFDQGGATLSAGVNMLVNETVSGLVATATYDVHIIGRMEGVNSNLSGRLRILTNIGGGGDQGLSRGFSGGVWTDVSVDGTRMGVTGVTSLSMQLWAEYQSGDPTALYSGSLVYRISPRGGTT